MNIVYKVFCVSLAVLTNYSIANASLVEVDLYSPGDKLITRDTATGLDWLDLTSTLNISYIDMLAKLNNGGQYYGFRFASTVNVDRLQQSAGLQEGLFFTSFSLYRQRVSDLMDKIGITSISTNSVSTFGLTNDPFLPTTYIQDRIIRGFSISLGTSAVQGVVEDDLASLTIGSWLVRETPSPVPIPNALLLFVSGILIFIKRKKISPR